MKYKAGDKVKVRNHLRSGHYYGPTYFNSYMEDFCGTTLTIKDFFPDTNDYDVFENDWSWSDEMFENPSRPKKFIREVVFK